MGRVAAVRIAIGAFSIGLAVGACARELDAVVVNDGIQLVGMLALAGEALHPDAVGDEQMIERAVHALEEGADIAAIVDLGKRERRLVQARVGPAIVVSKLLEAGFHDVLR